MNNAKATEVLILMSWSAQAMDKQAILSSLSVYLSHTTKSSCFS